MAVIEIDMEMVRHTQHTEIMMLEGTQSETLLFSTMHKETQTASQMTRYHDIMGAEVDVVGNARLPFSPSEVPHGGIMDGYASRILPWMVRDVDASHPVINYASL